MDKADLFTAKQRLESLMKAFKRMATEARAEEIAKLKDLLKGEEK